jgi:protein HIRA/HIR1
MPLVEIPLWVNHGTAEKKKSILPTAADVIDSTTPTTNNDVKSAEAKDALSLLPNNKTQQRPPMYGVDVHPDGTRFATASGDGTVKIWSMGGLFGGRFDKSCNDKRKKGWSEFTEGGNYVSSNSEGEGYDTSSSVEMANEQVNNTVTAAAAAPPPQQNVPVGVNDLTGLVRSKKGNGGSAKSISLETKPLSSTPAASDDAATSNTTELINNTASTNQQPQTLQPSNINTTTQSSTIKQPKLLTTISSSHTGSILSLRFSPSGIYLATAGDDSYINIYARSNTATYKGNLVGVDSNGNKKSDTADVEHWNRIAIGRGHALDVVGLAWAPDDSHLVSCSLDSVHPVIVWRLFDVLNYPAEENRMMNNTATAATIHNLHPFKILGRNVHTSTVKGVAFDPAGKYIATSGDDPAICIWRAFDDWGLEARVDSTSGVFRSKKRKRKNAAQENNIEEEEDDPGELASLSLFRRISFAPDGSHVCGTNASLRGKNIAAMISREGWAASVPSSGGGEGGKRNQCPPGAANLVGHKQPVVSSRHCPVFFEIPKKNGDSSESEDDSDAEPEYATLVALGDKKGFVTVWSTKLSRPLFKMQCSESRCTVTDISWGFVSGKNCTEEKDSLVMIVSLLDGFVVAINFTIPDEVGGGSILSSSKQRRIFQLKYGIEDFVGMYGFSPEKRRGVKRLVDDAGPTLIENALQLTMEMENEAAENDNAEGAMSKAKKRGRPPGTRNVSDEDDNGHKRKKSAQDPLRDALDAAARADATTRATGQTTGGASGGAATNNLASVGARQVPASTGPVVNIPYVANKVYSVDLPLKNMSSNTTLEAPPKLVADVVNSPNTPGCMSSAILTISRGGVREWKDLLAQVSCTALAANHDLLAVGTADGCLLVYGTSPTLGWESAKVSFNAYHDICYCHNFSSLALPCPFYELGIPCFPFICAWICCHQHQL